MASRATPKFAVSFLTPEDLRQRLEGQKIYEGKCAPPSTWDYGADMYVMATSASDVLAVWLTSDHTEIRALKDDLCRKLKIHPEDVHENKAWIKDMGAKIDEEVLRVVGNKLRREKDTMEVEEGEEEGSKGRGETKEEAKVKFVLCGTPFQLKVWKHLAAVPVGQTTTYGEIAEAIGHPKAVRAVGTAVGNNNMSLIMPCHRVLRSAPKGRRGTEEEQAGRPPLGVHGKPASRLGGYRWGNVRKAAILQKEGIEV